MFLSLNLLALPCFALARGTHPNHDLTRVPDYSVLTWRGTKQLSGDDADIDFPLGVHLTGETGSGHVIVL
jgi:hypothetical protein